MEEGGRRRGKGRGRRVQSAYLLTQLLRSRIVPENVEVKGY